MEDTQEDKNAFIKRIAFLISKVGAFNGDATFRDAFMKKLKDRGCHTTADIPPEGRVSFEEEVVCLVEGVSSVAEAIADPVTATEVLERRRPFEGGDRDFSFTVNPDKTYTVEIGPKTPVLPNEDGSPVLSIEDTLAERGGRYGSFRERAEITQGLKKVMHEARYWLDLTEDKKEALEEISNKIGRILNGDPEYHDNWHDIEGYARLVSDTLERG